MKKIMLILKAMRPKQWIKNVFLFPAVLFSKEFLNPGDLLQVFMGFLLFCGASGAVYLVNDIIDRDKDRLHPKKCRRPIASGELAVKEAWLAALLILVCVGVLAFVLSFPFAVVLCAYVVIVFLYSTVLKKLAILDIMAIAAGFVLRTLAGAVVINVTPSPWLLLCTSVLCLYLAANKRNAELAVMKEGAGNYKASLQVYTPAFLNQIVTVCLSLSIVLYALYTYFSATPLMMATTVFVIYGLFRYQLLISRGEPGDSIELVVLKDKPIIIDAILWAITCVLLVWRFY